MYNDIANALNQNNQEYNHQEFNAHPQISNNLQNFNNHPQAQNNQQVQPQLPNNNHNHAPILNIAFHYDSVTSTVNSNGSNHESTVRYSDVANTSSSVASSICKIF